MQEDIELMWKAALMASAKKKKKKHRFEILSNQAVVCRQLNMV